MSEIVYCHSGYEYAERPIALMWQQQRMEIAKIEAEWLTPGGHSFIVKTQNGELFELFYNTITNEWQIHPKFC